MKRRPMKFSAVILAGGRSLRMGCDKALLEIDGQTLLARQVRLARSAGASEVFISGRADADYSAFGRVVLKDRFRDAGPLAGIERALDTTLSPSLLVLAVDMPRLHVELLQQLLAGCSEGSGAIPRLSGYLEPLTALYPKSAHALAVSQLEIGCFAVKDFAARCVRSGLARFIDLEAAEARYFANWNSPASS